MEILYIDVKWQRYTFYIMVKDNCIIGITRDKADVLYHQGVYSLKLTPFKEDVLAFFRGEKCDWDSRIRLEGTEFQVKVWSALMTIPFGTTVSYSDIARKINQPNAVRAVGQAISKNPILLLVPCHRVIGKNGSLTGFSSGLDLKSDLLDYEKNTSPKS